MRSSTSARVASLAIFLVSPSWLAACVGDVHQAEQDSGPAALAYEVSGTLDWIACAEQGALCELGDARRVRFGGADGNYVVVTLSGTIRCDSATFGVDFGDVGNGCSIEAAAPAAADADTSHSMPATPAADAGHDMGTAAAGMGTRVASALPVGDDGAAGPQVEPSSEQPGASDGTGSFRTRCNFSHMSYDDPIVFPGQPGAAHLHAFFGNGAADAYSTAESLKRSGNSTCRGGTLNRTAYWAPALIDAAGAPVKPLEVDVYYKTGYHGVRPADVQPLPEGLRMIAGDAKASAAQSHAFWGCKDNYIGERATITDCGANDLVMMVVIFPQCWDGVNLDSDDHKRHLAYPDGGCPASHPVPLPEVTMKVYYPMPAGGTLGYRLASDMYDASMPGGYSAHADYFAAWDKDTMSTFVKNCDNAAVDCHSHLLGDGRMLF